MWTDSGPEPEWLPAECSVESWQHWAPAEESPAEGLLQNVQFKCYSLCLKILLSHKNLI